MFNERTTVQVSNCPTPESTPPVGGKMVVMGIVVVAVVIIVVTIVVILAVVVIVIETYIKFRYIVLISFLTL